MITGKIAKGTKVYYASNHISEKRTNDGTISLCMVIERTVDACGTKQMTFEDDGNDSVFGRSIGLDWSYAYFTTPEAAFAYLAGQTHPKIGYEIHPTVMSDKTNDWVELAKTWRAN